MPGRGGAERGGGGIRFGHHETGPKNSAAAEMQCMRLFLTQGKTTNRASPGTAPGTPGANSENR